MGLGEGGETSNISHKQEGGGEMTVMKRPRQLRGRAASFLAPYHHGGNN